MCRWEWKAFLINNLTGPEYTNFSFTFWIVHSGEVKAQQEGPLVMWIRGFRGTQMWAREIKSSGLGEANATHVRFSVTRVMPKRNLSWNKANENGNLEWYYFPNGGISAFASLPYIFFLPYLFPANPNNPVIPFPAEHNIVSTITTTALLSPHG